MIRLALALLWLLHFLPMTALSKLGSAGGWLAYALATERRRVALINLRLCFPGMSEAQRKALTRRHFQAFCRAILEQGISWWSRPERLFKLIRLEGIDNWQAVADGPVIFMVPHFVGLDIGGFRIGAEYPMVVIYGRQKNPRVNALLLKHRNRFRTSELYARQEGLRPVVKAMRRGLPFYYPPDQDFGARDAIFVPFFGVTAATVPALSRIARMTGAKVVPCVTRQCPRSGGYVTTFFPAWENFPSGDLEQDTRRMNAFIEARVAEMPEQYFWTHKRFKTRPPGETHFYDPPRGAPRAPSGKNG